MTLACSLPPTVGYVGVPLFAAYVVILVKKFLYAVPVTLTHATEVGDKTHSSLHKFVPVPFTVGSVFAYKR